MYAVTVTQHLAVIEFCITFLDYTLTIATDRSRTMILDCKVDEGCTIEELADNEDVYVHIVVDVNLDIGLYHKLHIKLMCISECTMINLDGYYLTLDNNFAIIDKFRFKEINYEFKKVITNKSSRK